MADTIPDIEADFADWSDVYTLTGIVVGTPVVITNKSSRSVLVFESISKPNANSKDGPPIKPQDQATITGSPTGLWIRSASDSYKSLVNVQEV